MYFINLKNVIGKILLLSFMSAKRFLNQIKTQLKLNSSTFPNTNTISLIQLNYLKENLIQLNFLFNVTMRYSNRLNETKISPNDLQFIVLNWTS